MNWETPEIMTLEETDSYANGNANGHVVCPVCNQLVPPGLLDKPEKHGCKPSNDGSNGPIVPIS